MPVTITIGDQLVDAITERRGSDPIFDELSDLIDSGFHYSTISYPNPAPYDWAGSNKYGTRGHRRSDHDSAANAARRGYTYLDHNAGDG